MHAEIWMISNRFVTGGICVSLDVVRSFCRSFCVASACTAVGPVVKRCSHSVWPWGFVRRRNHRVRTTVVCHLHPRYPSYLLVLGALQAHGPFGCVAKRLDRIRHFGLTEQCRRARSYPVPAKQALQHTKQSRWPESLLVRLV